MLKAPVPVLVIFAIVLFVKLLLDVLVADEAMPKNETAAADIEMLLATDVLPTVLPEIVAAGGTPCIPIPCTCALLVDALVMLDTVLLATSVTAGVPVPTEMPRQSVAAPVSLIVQLVIVLGVTLPALYAPVIIPRPA